MRNRVYALSAGITAFLCAGVTAQQPTPVRPAQPQTVTAPACPRIEMQGPGGRIIREGQTIVFSANISGGNDVSIVPTMVWSVSSGMIKGGQGTRSIEVDTSGAGAERQIVAELWVGGYPAECTVQGSVTARVVGPAAKADEFGDLALEAEAARLENVAAALPDGDNLYVIAYAGRTSVRGHAAASMRRIKDQLVKLGVPAQRVVVVDGGFREQAAFEIWIVPVGAETPRPSPTVDRKEIVYPPTPRPTPVRKP
jgi:hypothetical protein